MEQLLHGVVRQVLQASDVQSRRNRHKADRGLHCEFIGGGGLVAAIQDPVEDTNVLTESGPQELAGLALAEPIDVEDFGELGRVGALGEGEPVLEIV